MRQERTPLGYNRHGLWAPRMEQFLISCEGCCEVTCEMAVHWYRVAEGNNLRRICSEDSYCIGFYLSSRRCKLKLSHIIILMLLYRLGACTPPGGILLRSLLDVRCLPSVQ